MVRRVFSNQHHAPDGACRVGMLLKGGIPEIFGKVLLTGGKADGWRFGVARERKRETNFGWGAVRPLALALEMHGIRDPDRRRAKAGRVRWASPSLHRRDRRGLQEHVLDRGDDRSVALAFGTLG